MPRLKEIKGLSRKRKQATKAIKELQKRDPRLREGFRVLSWTPVQQGAGAAEETFADLLLVDLQRPTKEAPQAAQGEGTGTAGI